MFLAFVVALDPANGQPSVTESLSLSWHATAPVAGPLLGLLVLCGLILMGSLLLLCVGIVFIGYPLAISVIGAAYILVFASRHEDTLPPQEVEVTYE